MTNCFTLDHLSRPLRTCNAILPPCRSRHGAAPIRRLWQYLIRQKPVQKVFIKYIFGRQSRQQRLNRGGGGGGGIPESQSYVSRLSAEAAAAAVVDGGDGSMAGEYVHTQVARMLQSVKIIHKDHDAVTAFCINKVSSLLWWNEKIRLPSQVTKTKLGFMATD